MNVVSLFDGISTGRYALEKAGIQVDTYTAFEIDKNAIKISQKNYPDIIQCGDVTKADFNVYGGADLLLMGSPCQSLSIVQSKTREGLQGKSRLFFECVRALEEIKPKYFLFENVASMSKDAEDTISRLLGCSPILIDSADFSAQQRPRYYWTNIPVDTDYPKSKAVLKDIMQTDVPDKYWYNYPLENINMSKQVCATMIHNNHEMHKRVFNPDFKCHTLTAVCGGNQQKKVLDNGRARKLTPLEYERLQTLPDGYTDCVCDGARYKALGNGWTADVIVHILKNLKGS